jgi:glycosyltransferase involved in cell wall biosynthesis
VKIGIDSRFLTHPQHGGFKTYTECLINALQRIDSQNEYVLYVDRNPACGGAFPAGEGFRVREVAGAVSLLGMPWREQVLLPFWARKDRLDVFHSPCLSAPLRVGCPLVVTVHDMIWHPSHHAADPAPRSSRQRWLHLYYRQVTGRAVRNASAVVTVSESSKREIVNGLGIPSDKVFVTYEAARPTFQQVDAPGKTETVRRKYDLPEEFILAIGAADPRKNTATLVDAYRLLPRTLRERYPLVIMWTHMALAEGLKRRTETYGLKGQVRFRQLNASNLEMTLLYNAAALFVFPSRYEGFGLPPLEAMACGLPVVAADNSSIPEVLGDAACYVESDDPAAIAAGIAHVLTDDQVREALREKGLRRARLFSWEACARETLKVYRQACG